MGKRYYCDYCDKTMPCGPMIIRTHNNGLVHQIAKQEHYQKFKDPELILAEELQKKPCVRFPTGSCKYGSMCRFSHYTPEAIHHLQSYVTTRQLAKKAESLPCFQDIYDKLLTDKNVSSDNENTILVDDNGISHTLPWQYNDVLKSYGPNLPPSIRPIKCEDFANVTFSEWG